MTDKLALPTLIALCSIALGRPVVSKLAVLGDITISGTMIKENELANMLQLCLDSGAKKVLIPKYLFCRFCKCSGGSDECISVDSVSECGRCSI